MLIEKIKIKIMEEKWNQIYLMKIWKITMLQATTYLDFLMKMKSKMMTIFIIMMRNIKIRKMIKMKETNVMILKKLK